MQLCRTIDQHVQHKNKKQDKQKRKENIAKEREAVEGYEFSNGGFHFTVF